MCNDSYGNEANDSISFVVAAGAPSLWNSSVTLYFEAGNATWYRFYVGSSPKLDVNITTSTNLTAKMHMLMLMLEPLKIVL